LNITLLRNKIPTSQSLKVPTSQNQTIMKTVLITGGSSGIGYQISKRFAQNGYEILWVSLLEQEMAQSKIQLQTEVDTAIVHTLAMDLSKADSAQKTYDWVNDAGWDVNVLINNAGFATFGLTPSISIEKEISMIQLNVLNVFKMTRLFLNDMLDKNSRTIINISSKTSFQPIPKMAAYAATKAFVSHYSQGLSLELKEMKSAVRVITVCPAAIKDTKFKTAAKMENVKTFEGLAATTKAEVAKDVWQAYVNGKDYMLSGVKLRRLMPLFKFIPKRIVLFLVKDELSEVKK